MTLGQLAAPVVMTGLMQALALVLIYALAGGLGEAPLVAALFTPPFNMMLFGVDNLLFLIYPTRLVAAGPGDLRWLLTPKILNGLKK